MMKIPLSNPDITELEKEYVFEVLNSPDLSLGPKLQEFEARVANYVETKYAVAVNSGTSGLHCCIKALGIREGDLVITTPFSFVASANCILFERGIPVFVDIDPLTLNIDPNKIEEAVLKLKAETSRLKAVLPVHVFGQPCEMDRIMEIAEKYNLKVIEDACETLGAEYGSMLKVKNSKIDPDISLHKPMSPINAENSTNPITTINCEWKKVGTFGDCGVFAFYPNKQMTTGEGGVIVTDNENIALLCRSLRNQGRDGDGNWLAHARLGYNYRLSDINCAIGLAQLERIDEMLEKRNQVASMYNERLKDVEGIRIPFEGSNIKMSWFVYVIFLDERYTQEDRDRILLGLRNKGIGCNNYFTPIHLQPFYADMFGYKKGDFPVTEYVSERTIALPFYNNLKEQQIDYVVENFKTLL